jgi:ABC-2 type transport system ATP-binding protein
LLSELELISEYLVMLRKGEVVFAGPIQELFDQQQPFMIVKTEREADLQRIIEIAQNAGHKAHKRDGTAHIEGPAEWAGVLNKLAFENGVLITQLSPQVPNLEETFFEMTGDQK